jgi:hypothetical protein
MASDFPFGIFKLFLCLREIKKSIKILYERIDPPFVQIDQNEINFQKAIFHDYNRLLPDALCFVVITL